MRALSLQGWLLASLLAACAPSNMQPAVEYSAAEYDQIRKRSEKRCLVQRARSSPNCSVVDKKCLLYYFHMHKTGGTTVCRAANRNQFKTTGTKLNCNIPNSVAAKAQYLLARNITFVAQEGGIFRPIRRKAITPLYFATIRDPLDRILSHLHHGLCVRGSNELNEIRQKGCEFDPDKHSFADVILGPCFENLHYTNNFYVQQFGGCSYGNCVEAHLLRAIDGLRVMSALVITEDFDRYAALLSAKFGLHIEPQFRAGTNYYSNAYTKLNNSKHGEEAYRKLVKLNALDIRFYKEARRLGEDMLSKYKVNITDQKCMATTYYLPKHLERLRGQVNSVIRAPPGRKRPDKSINSTSAVDMLCVAGGTPN